MESACHVSEQFILLGLFMRRNEKCKPQVRTLGFIGSVYEKNGKCKPCVRTLRFIGSVHEKKW